MPDELVMLTAAKLNLFARLLAETMALAVEALKLKAGDDPTPLQDKADVLGREAEELVNGLTVITARPGVAEAVGLLRELLKLDYNACAKLVGTYTETNPSVAGHPTIQVGEKPKGGFELGFIGVLNGLLTLHTNAEGYIGVLTNPDGTLRDFVVLDRTEGQAKPDKPDAPILDIKGPPPPPRLVK